MGHKTIDIIHSLTTPAQAGVWPIAAGDIYKCASRGPDARLRGHGTTVKDK